MKDDRPLRLLCLHGYQQNAAAFRRVTARLQAVLSPGVVLDCLDGFYVADEERNVTPALTWWRLSRTDGPDGGGNGGYTYGGAWEAVQYVVDRLINQGPYDGILGFSQGAAMASVVAAVVHGEAPTPSLALSADLRANLRRQLRFGIFIGGFKPRDPALHFLYAQPIPTMQTLHVIGEADDVLRPVLSCELRGAFAVAEVFEHPGGHVIPSDGAAAARYRRCLGIPPPAAL
jgi:hypothetical protein